MSKEVECIICGTLDAEANANDPYFHICPNCGRYEILNDGIGPDINEFDRNKLGPFLYYNGFKRTEMKDGDYRYYTTLAKEVCDEYVEQLKAGDIRHGHPVHLSIEEVNTWYPDTFAEKIDQILLALDRKTQHIGQKIVLSKEEAFSCMFVDRYDWDRVYHTWVRRYSAADNQAIFMLNYLIGQDYVTGKPVISNGEIYLTLTPKGLARIEEIQRDKLNGDHILVAMKFGDDTKALREAIRQGVTDAGYHAIFIDEVEHNEFITPELLKYIRNSKFVVVDLSHQNNGAYFEEGYAMGLGKPVIQLCKSNVKLHFDIAQINTIIWDKEEDIPLRLKKRV